MRRRLLALVAPGVLFTSLGCIAFTDDRGPLALDYEIDRVLIPAMRTTPLAAVQGEPLTIEALVLAPGEIDEIAIDVCGLDPELPSDLWGTACFDNEDLVSPLGDALPLTWDVPLLGSECTVDTGLVDTGGTATECASEVPLRITAWAGDDRGMGALDLVLRRRAPLDPLPSLADSEATLTYDGTPARGQELALVYRVDWQGDLSFRWYVDAGELHFTGRTDTTWLQNGRHTTRNQLSVPSGYVGPLRVVVVAVDEESNLVPNMRWDILTLEIAS